MRKLLKMAQIRRFYVNNLWDFFGEMRPQWLIQDNKD